MNWRISIIMVLLVITSCKKQDVIDMEAGSKYLITAKELLASNNNETIKILDFRKEEDYSKGHIEGAIQIWRNDIQNPNFEYGGIMASPEQIENLFRELGIDNDDTLVVYDEKGLCEAARLWWILQNYNFDRVKLLSDGLKAWQSEGGKMSTSSPKLTASNFKFDTKPSMKYYIDKNGVSKAINKNHVILDTRNIDEFTGLQQKKGAAKAGRIKNSIHIDWAEAINYETDKSIKPIEELEKIYGRLNAEKTDSIILYCHSGVRSAHTTFVLTQLLGYKNVWNYDGSWTEWSHFEELPYENESLTFLTTIKK